VWIEERADWFKAADASMRTKFGKHAHWISRGGLPEQAAFANVNAGRHMSGFSSSGPVDPFGGGAPSNPLPAA
jgi:hypothetical protein